MDESTTRRLPVYLLLDCSGSMSGEPIESVRQGIWALIGDLRSDPAAIETVYISVISFGSSAHQITPLTELLAFEPPDLVAGGSTAMGEALRLLEECIRREVRTSSPTQKGDWKPLIFVMTDGMPTDIWEDVADRIKQKRLGNIIACAAGPSSDPAFLHRLTETVIELNSLQPDTLKSFFRWASASIKATSMAIPNMAHGAINLPPPPPSIQIVP
jgi:uncharacterized protein YegL